MWQERTGTGLSQCPFVIADLCAVSHSPEAEGCNWRPLVRFLRECRSSQGPSAGALRQIPPMPPSARGSRLSTPVPSRWPVTCSGHKRRAANALYAFCRVADDLVDQEDAEPSERAAKLETYRTHLVCPGRHGGGRDLPRSGMGREHIPDPSAPCSSFLAAYSRICWSPITHTGPPWPVTVRESRAPWARCAHTCSGSASASHPWRS